MKRLLQLGLLLASLNMISAFATANEVNEYMEIFQTGSYKAQTTAANQLQWSGISDKRLFDLIESKLLTILPSAAADKQAADVAAWYAKALGISGQDKYQGTLNKMAQGTFGTGEAHPKLLKKLMKYGLEGIDLIPKYKKWNPIISNSKNFRADKSLQTNRYANMLKSNEWELQLIATKRMNHEKITDPSLLDLLNAKILKDYQAVSKSSDEARIDAFQWMIRTLAALGAPKYLETMQEVSTKGSGKGVAGYAKKITGKFY
jgi:hypothetical protein